MKSRNSSFERTPDSFAYFANGLEHNDDRLEEYAGSPLVYFRHKMNEKNIYSTRPRK